MTSQIILQQGENTLAMDLATLQQQVTQNTTLEQRAIALIQGIAAQLKSASTDPAQIQAIADQLSASAAQLSAELVAESTPTTPPSSPSPTT